MDTRIKAPNKKEAEIKNTERLDMESKNWVDLGSDPNANPYLYPDINDPNFNIKISIV